MGILNNTYFIYTSDHGFHLGQWGMGYDKRQLYEHDLRVPFYISGPGIESGTRTDIIALNIDIAPTITDLTANIVHDYMDGRSLTSFMFDSKYQYQTVKHKQKQKQKTTIGNRNENGNVNNYSANGIKQEFMVEYSGEASSKNPYVMCGGYPGYNTTLCDSWNNTYQCVRTIDGTQGQINGTIYCRFTCYDDGHNVVDCDKGTPESEGEYYEMDADPFQLTNLWSTLSSKQVQEFEDKVTSLLQCQGQSACNAFRGNVSSTVNPGSEEI